MYPLGLGVVSWWWLAILATAVFWAVLVPGMPTRTHRISMALAPAAMVVFGLGSYYAKHMDAAAVLAMYSFAVVAFPVGMVGHRRKFAQRLMEAKERGESEDNTWPPAMMAQVFVSLVVFGTAAIWTTR
ncbi:hypothetical protein DR950_05445 [Kitasatospora xanthocidica]|uniref:Uncharacterized protein n=2 Tax=Kitasatosporales TaxID=85011 RepID=A0A372ZPJ1_9ACTN|nr:hypothetical protein AMK13_16690 [Streptomyces sp. CB02056]RGD57310.1 hypothetical protein DR950_05445 [Kitasatospora xanthocidica]